MATHYQRQKDQLARLDNIFTEDEIDESDARINDEQLNDYIPSFKSNAHRIDRDFNIARAHIERNPCESH